MKKGIIALFLIFSCLNLVGCSSNEENNKNNTTTTRIESETGLETGTDTGLEKTS